MCVNFMLQFGIKEVDVNCQSLMKSYYDFMFFSNVFFIQRIQALQKLEKPPKKLKICQTQKSRKVCETQKTP